MSIAQFNFSSNIKVSLNLPLVISPDTQLYELLFIGPLGKSTLTISSLIQIKLQESKLSETKLFLATDVKNKALLYTYKKLIDNIIIGVTEGYTKRLKLEGIGYKVSYAPNFDISKQLIFKLGYSHDIIYLIPLNIEVKIINPNLIEIKGINKIEVGQCIATIKNLRKPNPYRIKGIYLTDENIKIKTTKKK